MSGYQSISNFLTFKNSYIPLKINQGGIMPLVFSSTIAVFFAYPIQLLLTSTLGLIQTLFLVVKIIFDYFKYCSCYFF